MPDKKRNLSPEKVVQILEEYGTSITLGEAKVILEHLRKFGKLVLNQLFDADGKLKGE